MPRPRLYRAMVLADIRRVSEMFQTQELSTAQYTHHGRYSLNAIARNLGWWPVARALALGLPVPQTGRQRKNRAPTMSEPKPKKRLAPSHHRSKIQSLHQRPAEPQSGRAGMTRCLGPGCQDHLFWSPDVKAVRVCRKAKRTLAWQDGGWDYVIHR